jgi:acyl carrier protein
MAAAAGDGSRARRERLGLRDLDPATGLDLLDAAIGGEQPLQLAARIDRSVLGRLARSGVLVPVLGNLAPTARRSTRGGSSLIRELSEVPEEERYELMLQFVLSEIAAVLDRESPQAIDPDAAFKDLGFDSLGAVEMRNRLALQTGVELEATVVFDYPTAAAVARYLLAETDLVGERGADPELAEVRRLLETIPLRRLQESGILATLRSLSGAAGDGASAAAEEIDAMDVAELVMRTLDEPAEMEA